MIEQATTYIESLTGSVKLKLNEQNHTSISFHVDSKYKELVSRISKSLGAAIQPSSREAMWFVPEGQISLNEVSDGAFIYLHNGPKLVTNKKLLAKAERDDGVYELFEVFHIIQKKYKVDFWDYFNSGNNYSNWQASKGYVKNKNATMEETHKEFKEYQSDIANKVWVDKPYCPFIDVVIEDLDQMGMEQYGQEDTLDARYLLEKAYEKDFAEFGHADWRVTCMNYFVTEIGEEINICWEEA